MIAIITFKAQPKKKFEIVPAGVLPNGKAACFGVEGPSSSLCSLSNSALCGPGFDICNGSARVIFKEVK